LLAVVLKNKMLKVVAKSKERLDAALDRQQLADV
jgi:hypothetical protein